MYNRRRFLRYNVTNLKSLKAQIGESNSRFRIVDLGAGGCGFCSFGEEGHLNTGSVIKTVLAYDRGPAVDDAIEVEGKVVYVIPFSVGVSNIFYFGVSFDETPSPKIKPILDVLEVMRQNSVIDAS